MLAISGDRRLELAIGAVAALGTLLAAVYAAKAARQSRDSTQLAGEQLQLQQAAALDAQVIDGLLRCDDALAEMESLPIDQGANPATHPDRWADSVAGRRWLSLQRDLRSAFAIASTAVPMVSFLIAWDPRTGEPMDLRGAIEEARAQVGRELERHQRQRMLRLSQLAGTVPPDRGHRPPSDAAL
jgi:hypothetical protein